MKTTISLTAILCAGLALTGCSTNDPASLAQNDPWEPTNRAVFDFDIKPNAAGPVKFITGDVDVPLSPDK